MLNFRIAFLMLLGIFLIGQPVLSADNTHPKTMVKTRPEPQGVGLLGIYTLAAADPKAPYYITNIFPISNLVESGMQPGDLLTKINGQLPFDYMHTGHPTSPGANIILSFEHEGVAKTVSAKLIDMRKLTPYLGSYGEWARGHISFLKEHKTEYNGAAMM